MTIYKKGDQIRCWSCRNTYTYEEFSDCEWNCPTCGNEGPEDEEDDE